MRKDQIITIAAIVVIGAIWAYVSGGISKPEIRDGKRRITDCLRAAKIPVVAVADTEKAGQAYLQSLRQALAKTPNAARVEFIIIDRSNPNEKEALGAAATQKGSSLVVIALSGQPFYQAEGAYDVAKATTAVAEGLTRPLIKLPDPHAPPEHSE
jgi:hypothetical protein